MKLQLGVFVKEPVPGQVKTRLTPPLTPEQAAALYRAALHETVERMQTLVCEVVLFFAGQEQYFREAFPDLPRIRQSGGDLGRRMTEALAQLHHTRPEAAALIGSDSPDLPLPQITAAFSALQAHDVVTIPARDGGYVLVGSRRHRPEIFQSIDWSTAAVLAQTRQRAAAAGLTYVEQGGWEDVDDLDSLRRLLARSPDSATAAHVRRNLSGLVDV